MRVNDNKYRNTLHWQTNCSPNDHLFFLDNLLFIRSIRTESSQPSRPFLNSNWKPVISRTNSALFSWIILKNSWNAFKVMNVLSCLLEIFTVISLQVSEKLIYNIMQYCKGVIKAIIYTELIKFVLKQILTPKFMLTVLKLWMPGLQD